jgi:tRNA(Ile)-lysidine synthase TilS/MesJ
LKALQAELAVLQVRTKLAEIEDEIRWAEDECSSADPARKREAEERLAKLRDDRDAFVKELETLAKDAAATR